MNKKPKNGRIVIGVIPVRELGDTKLRLSSILTKSQRAKLTLAMLRHVISVIEKSGRLRKTIIVCSEKEESLSLLAKQFRRVSIISESKHHGGVSRAVEDGIEKAMDHFRQVDSILVTPSDLPLLSARVLQGAISKLDRFDLLIAPSSKKDGTNLLLFNLPRGRIALHYDDDSYKKHLAAARRRKVKYEVIDHEELSFDVDTWEDLESLRARFEAGSFCELLRAIENP